MWNSIAADAVMAFHFAFIAFALLGSFLVLRWPKVIWLHLPALAWGAYIELSGNICPLTPLENHFRALAGESTTMAKDSSSTTSRRSSIRRGSREAGSISRWRYSSRST